MTEPIFYPNGYHLLEVGVIAGLMMGATKRKRAMDRGDCMLAINKLDRDKVIEIAQNLGYDPEKPGELDKYRDMIAKMDLWDISKILFFSKKSH